MKKLQKEIINKSRKNAQSMFLSTHLMFWITARVSKIHINLISLHDYSSRILEAIDNDSEFHSCFKQYYFQFVSNFLVSFCADIALNES